MKTVDEILDEYTGQVLILCGGYLQDEDAKKAQKIVDETQTELKKLILEAVSKEMDNEKYKKVNKDDPDHDAYWHGLGWNAGHNFCIEETKANIEKLFEEAQ